MLAKRLPTILPTSSDLKIDTILKTCHIFITTSVHIILTNNELLRPPNTDNKGKLLVTLFARAFCLRMGTGNSSVSGPLRYSQL